jgi:hypothetical protein
MTMALVGFLNYVCMHILEYPLYSLSTVLTFLVVGYAIAIKFGGVEEDEREEIESVKFLVIVFLSMFMGPQFPLVLGVCLLMEGQMWPCYNYAIFMSLLSKCVWWWLGNRYEYSGVDILKTYVYSDSYAIALNALSLIVYLNSPFLLNFTLLNCRLLIPKSREEIVKIQTYELFSIVQFEGSLADEYQAMPFSAEFVKYLQSSNMKFTAVLLLGLISSIWTTLYNNEKILFTVVCVPVLVLISLVTLTTLLMVVLILAYYESKIKQEHYQEVVNTNDTL